MTLRIPIIVTFLAIGFTTTFDLQAAGLKLGKDIAMSDSLALVKQKLDGFCTAIDATQSTTPDYPLARFSVTHLSCQDYSDGPLAFSNGVFVFADDRLTHFEARNIDTGEVRRQLGNADGSYLGMQNFEHGHYWLDEAQQRLVWITDAGRHLNLFAWRHPYLEGKQLSNYDKSTSMPRLLDFHTQLADQRAEYDSRCGPLQVDIIHRPWLPTEPSSQTQVNCFNYPFAGFARKLEAIHGDGKLQMVWVLTAKPEEERIRRQLITDWGPPDISNDVWEVYGDGRISLRKDKPELLILSDEMIPHYQAEFRTKTKEHAAH